MKHHHVTRRKFAGLAALALLASGCIVTETVGPLDPTGAIVRRVLRAEFEVHHGGAVVGRVREFGRVDDPADHYFSVLNPWQQEVGLVDDLGRYWRFVPHEETPRHVGSGTLEGGVQRLLDLPGEPVLVPVDGA